MTRLPGSHARTLAAATRLRALGVTVVLKTPVLRANADAASDLARLARDLGCGHSADPQITCRDDGDLAPTRLRLDDPALRAFYGSDDAGVWSVVRRQHVGRTAPLDENPCRAGTDMVAIGPRGEVHPCGGWPLLCGDLRRQSFAEIWRSAPELARVRALTWQKIEPCNRCALRSSCRRCHGLAALEDGDPCGPSREACRHAVIVRDLLRERGLLPAHETDLPPTLGGEHPSRERAATAAS